MLCMVACWPAAWHSAAVHWATACWQVLLTLGVLPAASRGSCSACNNLSTQVASLTGETVLSLR